MARLFSEREETGASLVEFLIALVLFSVVIISVDSSITVIQERSVAVANATQALDNIQVVQQAISTDIHAAQSWTTPALPTSMPGSPVTATTLNFTTSLNNATATIAVALNTATHVLSVNCSGSSTACPGNSTGTVLEAQVSNVDSSSLFTLTTKEVSTTQGGVTTNTFYYTKMSSTLIVDSPRVGAPRVTQTILTSPGLEIYNAEYACQTALSGNGATGSC